MRVLVTGATGFLGHAVVAALAARGHEVVALSRTGSRVPEASAACVRGDIRQADTLASAVAGVEAVCHLAALARVRESLTDPLAYWQTNTVGTINLLQALAATSTTTAPKCLVLASTCLVYETAGAHPIDESAPTAPSNPYGASKLAADQAAAHLAATGVLGAVSLRAFNIAGASGSAVDRDETRLIPKILAVQAGRAAELVVNGDGSAVRDFVHVADMADAVVRALDACTPGTWRAYNVGSGHRTAVRDVIAAAQEVTGRPVPVRHRPAAPEPPVLLADSTRIRTELGWQPRRSQIRQILTDAWSALASAYAGRE